MNSKQIKPHRPAPGITRDDSDDELGVEDIPWQWIRENSRSRDNDVLSKIFGARMGNFECYIGDAVFLKAEGINEAWVAIICEFMENNETNEKSANFMWFSSEKEIRNRAKKRLDFMPNELYLTPSWDVNPLTSINGHATIMSVEKFMARCPSGKVPCTSRDFGKIFVCRRGCNTRTAVYTKEFIWENIYGGTEDLFGIIDMIKTETKLKSVRKCLDTNEFVSVPTSPQSSDGDQKEPKRTTDLNRGSVKKSLTFTPLTTRTISLEQEASSPYQAARARLHVSAVPESLPCREKEFAEVYTRLAESIADGTGNCFYISGTPGTGKTATVREVISRLEVGVKLDELEDFIFVEINGMKITDPYQAYTLLWEALKGQRVRPTQALDLLEREFNNPTPRRVPCVVLMDELDQLVTKNQGIMYNFFNWPSLRHSKLIVLAVANTMDLPERTLSNKISSRLGLTRITFPGYSHEQLVKIIKSRLDGVPGYIVDTDAIQFASRKVAAVSGDARRALDICRRAVEIAETAEVAFENMTTLAKSPNKQRRVTISTVIKAITEATSNPIQQHLRALPTLTKLVLVALVQRLGRTGLAETCVGDVTDETRRIFESATIKHCLPRVMIGDENSGTAGLSPDSYGHVCGLLDALSDLASAGIITLESYRTDRASRVRLAVGSDDIAMGFKEDAEVEGLGLSLVE